MKGGGTWTLKIASLLRLASGTFTLAIRLINNVFQFPQIRLAIDPDIRIGFVNDEFLARDRGEQSVQPEPRAARFLKSTLVGRGPVNRVVIRKRHA